MDVIENRELVSRFSIHPLATRVLSKDHELGFVCDFNHWKETLDKSTNPFEIAGLLEICLSRIDWVNHREILDIYLSYADGWRELKFLWRGEKGIQEEGDDRDFGALALARKAFLALCRHVWQNDRSENNFLDRKEPSWTFRLEKEEIEKILDFLLADNFPKWHHGQDYPEMVAAREFVLDLYHMVFHDVYLSSNDWEKDVDGGIRSRVLRLVAQEMPQELTFLMVGDAWKRVSVKHERDLEKSNKDFNRGQDMTDNHYEEHWEIIPRVLHFLRGVKEEKQKKKENSLKV